MNAPLRKYRYDRRQTYQWNFENAPPLGAIRRVAADSGRPASSASAAPEQPGDLSMQRRVPTAARWRYLDWPVSMPCAVAAGPLLNGRWTLYAAECGFDVLTYKTVRSRWRASFPLPNLQPVGVHCLHTPGSVVVATEEECPTWAVSFGMPSQAPELWRRDVRWTRDRLPPSKKLVVSVVGTVREATGGTDALAVDFARCARWAKQAGADAIEANFSCPNVSTPDAQLQHDPMAARHVARRIRDAIGTTPLLVKLGFLPDDQLRQRLVSALAEFADALVMTNSIPARVRLPDGEWLFGGEPRGICGAAIRDASLRQIERFAECIDRHAAPLQVIGVGGIRAAADVRRYLDAGASAVQVATAFMHDPLCAAKWKDQLASDPGGQPDTGQR